MLVGLAALALQASRIDPVRTLCEE